MNNWATIIFGEQAIAILLSWQRLLRLISVLANVTAGYWLWMNLLIPPAVVHLNACSILLDLLSQDRVEPAFWIAGWRPRVGVLTHQSAVGVWRVRTRGTRLMNLCHSFMENDCFGLLLAFIMNSVLCNMCQRKTPLNSSGYKHGHFFLLFSSTALSSVRACWWFGDCFVVV